MKAVSRGTGVWGPSPFSRTSHPSSLLSKARISVKGAVRPPQLNTPPTEITTLPNKLRVASEYRHGETATVGVWINTGSAFEDERTNGVAHFLEHMAFKGTKNMSQQQIESEFENLGGHLNAYTSREQTVYHAHVFKKDVPRAVEILADILQNSSFKPEDVERERSVILREMVDVDSQLDEVVFEHLHSIAFQGSPMGFTILGPEANIKRIVREDLVRYVNTHYTAPRMAIVGAGAIDHEELVKLASKNFSTLSPEVFYDMGGPAPDFVGSMVHVRNDDIHLCHTVVGMPGVGWTDPDYFAFMVIQLLVGSWDRTLGGGKNMSSRVCEKFASNELAHSLMSFNTCYNKTGLFGAYIVSEKETVEDAVKTLMHEWVRIAHVVNDHEVELAKNKLKASFLMQLDGTHAIAEDIGRQILNIGRRISPAEAFLRIDAIDTATIRQVAARHLTDTDPAVVGVGAVDTGTFPDYNNMRFWTQHPLL